MAAPFDHNIIDAENDGLDPTHAFFSELNDLCKELHQLIHLSSTSPPNNLANMNVPTNDKHNNDDHNNDKQSKLDHYITNCDTYDPNCFVIF